MTENENTTRDIAACIRERVVPPGGSRHGLVIGIEQYRDSRLNLHCAAADAKAIFDLMTDADCGMFPRDNVRLLLNEEATRGGIWRAMSALRRSVGDNDTVWLYYAGHAAPEGSDLYWVTHDADVDDLYGTGLGNDQISKVLADIPAKRMLVLLDCCHAAATAAQKNPARAVLTADELFSCYKGHGRITLASSDGKEKSVELGDAGHGAFTYFLEQGLRGAADADGDGVVTADELWRYLQAKVADASQKAGSPQTPVLLGEMRHDFALSLNPLEFGRRRKISDAIRALVGVASDQLTTEEGQVCLELLRHNARNQAEKDLLAEFPSLLKGRLRLTTLRRLIADVRETAPCSAPAAAVDSAHHEQRAEEKTSPKASARRPDDCKIVCADDFDQLPGKYRWDRAKTLDTINRWSSKHLGVLSNMADRCEVLDIQAHGYFVWQAKMVVEKRKWAEYRMGINVPNPSGLLEFLKHKPPRVPKLTPELAERLGEICPDCHGTGEYVCPECFGRGEVQCLECRGVGMRRDDDGTYSSGRKCDVCRGAKKLPCTACKGVPKRQCTGCNGTGDIPTRTKSKGSRFPATRDIAALMSVAENLSGNAWKSSDDIVIGDDPKAIEPCTHCHGTGEYVCPECFGGGEVQCPKCRGVGMERYYDGTYSSRRKCDVCRGAKKLPCTACKDVPKRPCKVCGGSGVVVVYPAIVISRTVNKHTGTSVSGLGTLGRKYTIPVATLEGDAIEVHQAAKTLLDRFEGVDRLRIAYVPKDKKKNVRITNFNVDIRWYSYILCRMKSNSTGMDFVIGINCACETVFLVSGECPKGKKGLGALLLGWNGSPFDRTIDEREREFMLKQLKQGE